MKKRLFATLLACAMTVSLVACGGSSSSSEKKEDTSDSKKQEASTEKEVTDITKMSDDEIKEAMKWYCENTLDVNAGSDMGELVIEEESELAEKVKENNDKNECKLEFD